LLVLGMTCILNIPAMFFEPIALGFRIAIPAFLLVGFAGALRRSKPLRFVGWIAIAYGSLYLLAVAAPGEDYTLGYSSSGPQFVSGWLVLGRFGLFLALALAMGIVFWRLGRSSAVD